MISLFIASTYIDPPKKDILKTTFNMCTCQKQYSRDECMKKFTQYLMDKSAALNKIVDEPFIECGEGN